MAIGFKLIKGMLYLGALTDRSEVMPAFHYPHLAEIEGMTSILKPQPPIEICNFKEIMSTDEYSQQ
jgi:hypothetical protein